MDPVILEALRQARRLTEALTLGHQPPKQQIDNLDRLLLSALQAADR